MLSYTPKECGYNNSHKVRISSSQEKYTFSAEEVVIQSELGF
jgi:hypothetical protein